MPNQERTLEKRKNQVLGNIGSGHYQTSRDERKKMKIEPQRNEMASRNQGLPQKPHQRYKNLCSPPVRYSGQIFK